MLVPERSGTWMSAAAPGGGERGGTGVRVAPRPLCLPPPMEAARVILDHVAGRHDDIRVLDVDQVRRHRPATERGPQSWDRGGVSDSSLMLVVDDAERPIQLAEEVALLVVDASGAQRGDRFQAVDDVLLAVLVLFLLDEVLLARVVVALGDLVVHPLQRLLLPLVRAGRAVERLGRSQRGVGGL